MKKRSKLGVSLVELVIVMAVMMIFVGIMTGLMLEVSNGWRRMSDYWIVIRPAQKVFNDVCADLESMCCYDLKEDRVLSFKIETMRDVERGYEIMQSCEFYKSAISGKVECVKYVLLLDESHGDGYESYELRREGMSFGLLKRVSYLKITPMLGSGVQVVDGLVPQWLEVEMRICGVWERSNDEYVFRRKIIVNTYL